MNAFRRHLVFAFAALLALAPMFVLAGSAPPNPEIGALIARVEQARGVVFIRNGSEHSASEAAAHLRRKLRAAHGRITTPEQFIDNVGTRSSMTRIAYRVRLADGREVDSASWLRGLLREVRANRISTPAPAASAAPAPVPARR